MEKIDVLCENFDVLTNKGKDELLSIGETYLNRVMRETVSLGDKRTDEFEFIPLGFNERLV